jgi:transcriptional regulator with XRE-family HTH domain
LERPAADEVAYRPAICYPQTMSVTNIGAGRAHRFALKLLGRRLRRARTDAGLSRQEVSGLTGISASRVANIENGYEQVKGSELFDLSETFNLPFDYFIADLCATDANGLTWIGDNTRLIGRYDKNGRALGRIAGDREIRSLIKEIANALSLVLP